MLNAQRYQFEIDKSKQVLGLTKHTNLLDELFLVCKTLHVRTRTSALSYTLNLNNKRHLDAVSKDQELKYVQDNTEKIGSSNRVDYDVIYLKNIQRLKAGTGPGKFLREQCYQSFKL